MKRLLSLTAVVVLYLTAWSQQVRTSESRVYVQGKATRTMVSPTRASIDPQAGQVWWCNYDLDDSAGWLLSKTSAVGRYSVATFIPYGMAGGSGTTINGLSFFPISSGMTNVKVWISTNLTDGIYLETKDVTTTLEAFNDVVFSNSYEIPSGGLYVGYSFDISSTSVDDYASNALLLTNTNNNRDGAFFQLSPSDNTWKENVGNLLVKVLFGGEGIVKNAASVDDFGNFSVLSGSQKSIPITVRNKGLNPITSLSYTISSPGSTVMQEGEVNVNIAVQGLSVINVLVPSETGAMEKNKTIAITKVNGVDNTYSEKSASGKLITVTQNSPVIIPVVEEFTATWCGYCPYGMVGMEKANEYYGDQVVLIAVHSDDIMEIPEYNQILNNVGSFPNASVNRVYSLYPYFSSIQYNVDKVKSNVVPGYIQAKATWTDNGKTAIKIDTETTFQYSTSDGHFAIAYVLVEDGLKGNSSSWAQSNYLSGSSGDSEMQFWYDSPSRVTGLEFNHVAVQAWEVSSGVKGSVSKSFTAGVAQKYSFTGDISSNSLIQDKSKLAIVTLLIDTDTGAILNAAKTTIALPELEINDIVQCIMAGTYDANADLNNDGKVDVADIVLFVNTHK